MTAVGLFLLMTALLTLADPPSDDGPANPFPADKPMPRYGGWSSSRIGGGGYIQNVVPTSDPRVYYSYVDVGGAYRSDDGGWSWRMLHGNLPARASNHQVRGLIVDPRDPDRILVATGNPWAPPEGVYVSDDGGDSFRRTLVAPYAGNGSNRPDGFILARHPEQSDVILTGTMGGGVFRSNDNGETWTNAGLDRVNVTDVRFDIADPDRAYACALPTDGWYVDGGPRGRLNGGFYRSDDGGRSWAWVLDESPSEIVQDRADPTRLYGLAEHNATVHLTTDGGETWREFSAGLPVDRERDGHRNEHRFRGLAAGPDFILTASTRGTFYRLAAGSDRWEKVERVHEINTGDWFASPHDEGHLFGSELGSIIIEPRDPDQWFFTDWYAIYRTADAGRNWALAIDGIEVTVIHQLLQDPSDPDLVHLGMADNGYLRSTNGGERFELRYGSGISNNVKDLALAPANPARLYAVGPEGWDWRANRLYVSDDKGLSWRRAPLNGLPDMDADGVNMNSVAVDPRQPDVVYLGISGDVAPGAGGPYVSRDGGQIWAWIGEGLPRGRAFYRDTIWHGGRELAVGADGTVMTAAQSGGSDVYRYDAPANRWQKLDAGLTGGAFNIAADVTTPGRFYVASRGGGIWRTTDNGETWQHVWQGTASHVVADSATPGRAAASTDDGVIYSADGGETWQVLDRSLPARSNGNMPAFAGNRLVIGSDGSGAFWIDLPGTTQAAR